MRLKIINAIRRKMEKGLPSVGTWQQISSSSISEILGNSGYDWVALDLEHGSISSNEITDMFRAFEMNNVDLVSWYFNYDDGSILVIDNLGYVYQLEIRISYSRDGKSI